MKIGNDERIFTVKCCFCHMIILQHKLLLLVVLVSLLTSLHAYDMPTQDYTVRKGDTLYSLARRYGVSVSEVMRINELENSERLKPGMLLKLPAKLLKLPFKDSPSQGNRLEESVRSSYGAHVVEPGETFYAIARKYSMSINELLELNGLAPNALLKGGQTLVIKAGARQSEGMAKAGGNHYWPVPGRQEMLKDEMKGVRIMALNQSLVYAVRDGKVMWQGPYRSYGVVTLVASNDGHVYLYGGNVHFLVNIGQDIRKGEPLGKVDSRVENQLAGQSHVYRGQNQQLANARKYLSQVYFSVFRNGQFVPIESAPRG